jgi:hypothetical protein|tara:strand:- start:344 stop:697 length:354 start_codon:yes stop_codon:yes gene_type:complete
MVFKKGNTGYTKRKPESNKGGRPVSYKTLLKRWEKDNPLAYAEAMETIHQLSIKGNLAASMYICDRLRGRPHQSLDQRLVSVELKLDASSIELALKQAREYTEQSLIEAGDPPPESL